MGLNLSIVSITLLLLIAQNTAATTFNVIKYGGAGDVTKGFVAAWKEACASTTPSTILIPKGTFPMNVVRVSGPCKAPLEIKLRGTLRAPEHVRQMNNSDGWITINYVNHLTISGGGTFDGQGALAWKGNDCGTNQKCKVLPINLRFNFVDNSIVRGVTSVNSKNFHVNVIGCHNFTFHHFTITTPEKSINTDGIHIGRSVGINITECNIKSGDDCISIGDGSEQIHVEKVTCGPGHGFSIGSLGRNMGEANVKGVYFQNCTLTNTQNGARIKTWPSSPPGYSCLVSDIRYEDIIMNGVGNPVIIDQQYCPWNQCNKKNPSLVQISDVTIKNIKGTAKDPIRLICSSGKPCQNVEIGAIDLAVAAAPLGKTAASECINVRPKVTGKQNPPICTSNAQSS